MSAARGAYLARSELALGRVDRPAVTIVGVEGEYAVAHTKITAEWLHDRFDTASSPVAASTWFVQGMHTLSPRWFVAARREATSSPVRGMGAFFARQPDLNSAEATIGLRATPELTLRSGWAARQFYGDQRWRHHAGVSAVWNWRWR